MDEILKLQVKIKVLSDELASFVEKPTKASSKRVRMQLNDLKKDITAYKQILVELDKAGY